MSAVHPVKHKAEHSRPAGAFAVQPIDADAIIQALRAGAATKLSSALGASPLVAFQTGALGNFPYYWQNPSNLEFNHFTYQWINTNLAAKTTPAAQDSLFTNIYLQALADVSFSLSTADQAALTAAQQNATNQQAALLNAWQQAFGSIPTATVSQQPIDIIMSTIATGWADPPTTLTGIQTSSNLFRLLNNTPASGKPILPVLAQYLNALGSSISLQNATTMNNGYLQQALQAVQSPTKADGALLTDDGGLRPAYQVSTQLSDILNGLKDTSNSVPLTMSVSRSSASEYTVSANGSASFSIPVDDFMSLNVNADASYFKDQIASSSNTVNVNMTFTGVTLVNFGPVSFDLSSGLDWFWMLPITQAIANGTSDVTGFKFSPKPGIDFSDLGPFGFMTGVAISNYPTIEIQVTSANFASIQQTFSSHVNAQLSFLGIPLASGSASSYSSSSKVDSSSQTVTITLTPPPELIAGTQLSSQGWVLGVQTDYPAAGN